jgi:N-acetyl sugar amidotransferase
MPRYCTRCVQPDTRPGIFLDERGVCSACVGHEEKTLKIDWEKREEELTQILDRFRGKNKPNYDCIIPVSGGKDSTCQAYLAKEVYKMHPLCVTYRTPLRTELGQKNLDNLVKRVGVDLIELTVNPEVERKFIDKAIREVGDPGLPEHLGIFSFTLQMAVRFRIPLVIWGESPQLEYGGTAAERANPYLDYSWLKKHGCLQQRLAEDWVGKDLSLEEMRPFTMPSDAELKAAEICSIFIGYYRKWDPVENAKLAMSLGFEARKEGPLMGIYNFADLDCKLITLHHYIKWLKFGMTRTFDNCAVEIRNGRMTRAKAIEHIRRNGSDYPPKDHIESVCEFLKISERDLQAMIEPFRNTELWKKDGKGEWYLPGYLEGIEG